MCVIALPTCKRPEIIANEAIRVHVRWDCRFGMNERYLFLYFKIPDR